MNDLAFVGVTVTNKKDIKRLKKNVDPRFYIFVHEKTAVVIHLESTRPIELTHTLQTVRDKYVKDLNKQMKELGVLEFVIADGELTDHEDGLPTSLLN